LGHGAAAETRAKNISDGQAWTVDSDLERDVINGPAIKHQTLASFARLDR
jgi:hypothetical protein